jgi:hypothetical protein
MKHLFSEAWSEDNNNSKKDGYCKISSDALKARLPEAIRITIQREKLKYNKKLDYHGNDSSNNKRKKKKTIAQE